MKVRGIPIHTAEFFSALAPGALLTILFWPRVGGSSAYLRLDGLASIKMNVASGLGFLMCAYVTGHVLTACASVTDWAYDRWYKGTSRELSTKWKEMALERRASLDPKKVTYTEDFGILSWCSAFLAANGGEPYAEAVALEGSAKFFRSLAIAFFVIFGFDAYMQELTHVLFSAGLTAICLWRSFQLRAKYTRRVYEHFVVGSIRQTT